MKCDVFGIKQMLHYKITSKQISSLHIFVKNGLWVKIVTTSPGLPYTLRHIENMSIPSSPKHIHTPVILSIQQLHQSIPSIFPWSYPGPVKLRVVRPLYDCSWWNPWPSLSEICFCHPPCFHLLIQLVHCPRLGFATALCAALFACCSYICLPGVSHVFLASFL